MFGRIAPALVVALVIGVPAVAGDQINGLPLHVERLSDNAIRLWVGDYVSSTAVAALDTDRGIVVIDTTENPRLDKKFRKIITREFGSDDFVYLINTHEHADHTTGNGVYADCEIIAHENCAEGMRRRSADSGRIIDWYENRIPELETHLAEQEKGTEAYKQAREELIVKKMVLESLRAGHELVFPTKTFSDSMQLEMGNMTLELYAVGGTHTASDIFVFVPEEGLLFTGDMMADIWLTDTPGCLQAFAIRQGVKRGGARASFRTALERVAQPDLDQAVTLVDQGRPCVRAGILRAVGRFAVAIPFRGDRPVDLEAETGGVLGQKIASLAFVVEAARETEGHPSAQGRPGLQGQPAAVGKRDFESSELRTVERVGDHRLAAGGIAEAFDRPAGQPIVAEEARPPFGEPCVPLLAGTRRGS